MTGNHPIETRVTIGFQRVLQRASLQAENEEITAIHLLISLLSENESYAAYAIEQQGITRVSLLNYQSEVSKKNHKHKKEESQERHQDMNQHSSDIVTEDAEESTIEKFCVNLNKKAENNDIEPLIGREEPISRIIHILCRKEKTTHSY